MSRWYRVQITGLNHRGEGTGRVLSGPDEGLVVFVPGTLPGDLVECFLVERKKNFVRGQVERFLEYGDGRVDALCKVASLCGGCAWQHIDYNVQLEWKARIVKEALWRVARISDCDVLPCVASPRVLGYRNKVEVPLAFRKGQVVAGFYEPFTHNVVPSDNCILEHPAARKVIANLLEQVKKRKYRVYNEKTGRGQIRHLVARVAPGTGECMAVPVSNAHRLPKARAMAVELMESTDNLKSVVLNINTKRTNVVMGDKDRLLAGRMYIQDILGSGEPGRDLGRLKFRISPRSFYQVNSDQAVNLYRIALSWAGIDSSDVVYDIYCGIGTITLFAALQASFAVGVEDVDAAIRDAWKNARDNEIDNVGFVCGKAERVLPGLHNKYPKPDVVILDPPRGGSDKGALAAIANLNPRNIVYVSCNPATLARDLIFLRNQGWSAVKCQPLDMFPMTPHVECVALMSRVKE
ncbi:MAG TPA: 23S rRNA (uracil(1939)-C(5))-methyltransferase RlmD [Firmicutes bacterium]|nr:23S rRNA (uracil(1939)-C(5))-methyltransferase RlmD [Candidatus Fermentithermobacillaceae bacterium]